MISSKISFILLSLMLVLAVSCSGGQTDILTPALDQSRTGSDDMSGTSCAGFWRVSIDPASGDVDISQPRSASYMLNALQFLEPPAMMWLSIDHDTLSIKPALKQVGVDVILRHPLNSPKFIGFDVRGLVFGPDVTNADGYTDAMSPLFFKGVPYGYIDGLLGTPDSEIDYKKIAGYKYFADNLGLNDELSEYFSDPVYIENRGVFSNGAQLARHYDLSWAESEPPVDFLVFNYAVYVNYGAPSGSPPYELDDFDILTANSADAFCVSVTEMLNTMWYYNGEGGGSISLDVEIYDWQLDVTDVSLTAVDVIEFAWGEYQGLGSTFKSFSFTFTSIPATPMQAGPMDFAITATDTKTFGEVWFNELLPMGNPMYGMYVYTRFKHTAIVSDQPPSCTTMESIADYQAYVLPVFPWQYLVPGETGIVCTKDPGQDVYIISSALKYYPVSYPTIGASRADSADPTDPDVMYPTPYMITVDIACDHQNNIYTVSAADTMTLLTTHFSGTDFTEPASVHTFDGNIKQICIDNDDNLIVLVQDVATDDHTIYHFDGASWNPIPVDDAIVQAKIQDFDYNPVQGHYVFVCSEVVIQLFAQDADGVIHYTDNELFGTQVQTFVPSIFIDQDSPDCHIVCWGTLDSASTAVRPIVRLSTLDYNIPKVLSSLTSSENGASSQGGAWAPGTNKLFVPAFNNAVGEITLPADW